jgi:hypothetical protein
MHRDNFTFLPFYTKAFDRANKNKLWKINEEKGFSPTPLIYCKRLIM